jgi:plasmid stabilization system protein ParE
VVLWYREHSSRAVASVAEINGVIEELTQAPERWPVLRNVQPPTRYRVLPSFPYTLFYRPIVDSILVVAVTHQKREPLYWTHRH